MGWSMTASTSSRTGPMSGHGKRWRMSSGKRCSSSSRRALSHLTRREFRVSGLIFNASPDVPLEFYLMRLSFQFSLAFVTKFNLSGHRNHCSLSTLQKTGPVRVLYLESVPAWRKFTATFDLGCTFFSKRHFVVAGSGRSLRAMMCHRSQLEWFRFLYILFSRYMTLNSYKDAL